MYFMAQLSGKPSKLANTRVKELVVVVKATYIVQVQSLAHDHE